MDRSYACTGNKTEYNNYNKGVEVLAPAGSLDICKAVINAGADAVYLGGDMFGARAYAGNLNKEEMFEALDYAHTYGRHIYLTVNTLLKHKEIDKNQITGSLWNKEQQQTEESGREGFRTKHITPPFLNCPHIGLSTY